MHRRAFIKTAGVATGIGLLGVPGAAQEDFPTESLTWMVPWAEGGGTDQYARQLAPLMEEPLGQSVAIDNREGAGSMVGSEWLSVQEPDGYTFGTINSVGAHFTWRAQEVDTFHIEEDFDPVAYSGIFGYTLIVNDDAADAAGVDDFGSLRDAYADGEISGFGYQGAGSDSHLTTLLLRDEYDLEYDTAVPYDGGGPTMEAVIGGEVAAGFATNTSAVAAEDSGEATAIVNLTDMDLSDAFPDIDPITDYGDSLSWITEFTLTQLAPAGTPEDVRQTLSEAIEVAVEDEDTQQWSEDTGNLVEYGDMEEAEELWVGIVDEQEAEVEDAIGGFDEFRRLAEEE
ncbi:Bug family tripartite tricarboxylate transporter substrate binding protein [Natronobeatus ordinarius]|uniref:Bug family tripartite tricarboxylate transporter substrate binding protein n=1 Tax=Natronobeatus ordinarius TaxID=2963433 RepID=UPI0020CC0AFF|nr:tripartite tricarboxylate transporter substrate binding protein [Natronobeatus ordinarius]